MADLTAEQKHDIVATVTNSLRSTATSAGCFEPTIEVTMHDTDASPMFAELGPHITFTVSGTARLDDYVQVNPPKS